MTEYANVRVGHNGRKVHRASVAKGQFFVVCGADNHARNGRTRSYETTAPVDCRACGPDPAPVDPADDYCHTCGGTGAIPTETSYGRADDDPRRRHVDCHTCDGTGRGPNTTTAEPDEPRESADDKAAALSNQLIQALAPLPDPSDLRAEHRRMVLVADLWDQIYDAAEHGVVSAPQPVWALLALSYARRDTRREADDYGQIIAGLDRSE